MADNLTFVLPTGHTRYQTLQILLHGEIELPNKPITNMELSAIAKTAGKHLCNQSSLAIHDSKLTWTDSNGLSLLADISALKEETRSLREATEKNSKEITSCREQLQVRNADLEDCKQFIMDIRARTMAVALRNRKNRFPCFYDKKLISFGDRAAHEAAPEADAMLYQESAPLFPAYEGLYGFSATQVKDFCEFPTANLCWGQNWSDLSDI